MKEEFNKLLNRQLNQHFNGNPVPEELVPLLKKISHSYDNYERDHRLIERAMDLSSDELLGANAELRKINIELDRFVYSTSHDLRAPLASILGLLNIIENENKDKNIKQYLKLIRESSNRLDRFIRDIIDYSRNARLKVEAQPIDFEKVIAESLDNLKFTPDSAQLTKNIHIENQHAFHSDAMRISVIFNNLLSNSIKYQNIKQKNSYVNVNVVTTFKEAQIRIEDNGLGIDPAYHDKIFDMFYRASTLSKGSGLGLYIVKETMARLKGDISVQSDLGKGTTFTLIIPNGV